MKGYFLIVFTRNLLQPSLLSSSLFLPDSFHWHKKTRQGSLDFIIFFPPETLRVDDCSLTFQARKSRENNFFAETENFILLLLPQFSIKLSNGIKEWCVQEKILQYQILSFKVSNFWLSPFGCIKRHMLPGLRCEGLFFNLFSPGNCFSHHFCLHHYYSSLIVFRWHKRTMQGLMDFIIFLSSTIFC